MFTNYMDLIYIYKDNLALNNLKWLICHKTKINQMKPNVSCYHYSELNA